MAPDDEPGPIRPSGPRLGFEPVDAVGAGPPERAGLVRSALGLALTGKPREELELERGLLTGIAAFRWAAWAWSAVVWLLHLADQPDIAAGGHPVLGTAALAAALAWTAAASVLARRAPGTLLDRWALAVELGVAGGLVFLDWFAYGNIGHAQSLGTVWPLAAVLTAGVAYGGWGGLGAGVFIGLARLAGDLAFLTDREYSRDALLSVSSAPVLYGLGGAVAGFLTAQLRAAERDIALARARDEVARTLHDGVLQTLAIVQRRAEDRDLVALAREQEHELREFLFASRSGARRADPADTADLGARLRAVSAEAERRYGLRSDVVLADPDAEVREPVVAAVAGAVGEALTNAAMHGGAGRATIYVDADEDGGLFCSVKDDGRGFDPAATAEGIGITRSIRGRLGEVGGSVTIQSRPGRGAEVLLQLPRA